MQSPLIFNVQRFSLHDGPGIRTTAFFKGCPLRCAWCHNPESQSFLAEEMFYPERCVHCGRCAEGCARGARERVGEAHDVRALAQLLLRDVQVYQTSGGGVTLSGGEPLAQDGEYLMELVGLLKRRGAHVAVETSCFAPWDRIEPLLGLVDLWLCDFKALDGALHEKYTGVANELILSNLRQLAAHGAKVWLRVPVVPGANADDGEMRRMAAFAREQLSPLRVNLLPYHRLGQHKRPGARLFDEPPPALMGALRDIWLEAGFADVKIGG